MKESDLALEFIEYFSENTEIYKEVKNGNGIVDFYAVTDKVVTAIEVKVCLSLALIEQGYGNLPYAHYSYIACPTCPSKLQMRICSDYGIGLLTRHPGGIIEYVKPRLNRKPKLPIFHDYQKESVAGSQSDRMTGFKDLVRNITRILYQHSDGLPIKQVFGMLANTYYRTQTSFRANLTQWCRNGVIKEFRIENGCILLNKQQSNNDKIKRTNPGQHTAEL